MPPVQTLQDNMACRTVPLCPACHAAWTGDRAKKWPDDAALLELEEKAADRDKRIKMFPQR